jgi:adenylate cyclase
MNELFNRAAAVVQRYQGTLDKFTGDGLMALFGAPIALEDHALRACISALEIQSVTKELAVKVRSLDGVDLQIRVGLNSGEVVAGDIGSGPNTYTVVGHSVGMAQRMEAAAPPGGIQCSLPTARLVEGAARLGPPADVVIKGSDIPVPARPLLGVESDRMILGRNEGLMLGREAELNWLRDIFDTSSGCLVGIVGSPGLGKSRLISEFTAIAASQGADIVFARCESHTSTVAFRALSRLLRAMFKVEALNDAEARDHTAAQCQSLLTSHSADAQILFEIMGIADTNAPQLQVSVDGRRRRLVEVMAQAVLARSARTVLALEDAHWIDAPSDDVLADFAATLSQPQFGEQANFRAFFKCGYGELDVIQCVLPVGLTPLARVRHRPPHVPPLLRPIRPWLTATATPRQIGPAVERCAVLPRPSRAPARRGNDSRPAVSASCP